MRLSADERKVWEARVADQKKSGMSRRVWCQQHGVTTHQLIYWTQQFREDSKTEDICAFKPVQIVEQQTSCAEIDIHLNGARIQVQPGFDARTLSEVLKVVASAC